MASKSTLTVTVSPKLKQAVDQIAAWTGEPVSVVAENALKHYVAWRTQQLSDLQQAVAAADRMEFASDDEVQAFFSQHGA